MTREEAQCLSFFTEDDVTESLDRIYDDFKSRTCENCKYIRVLWIGDALECSYGIRQYETDYFIVEKDFGCNKFERKTK
jgi:hypothetical protein